MLVSCGVKFWLDSSTFYDSTFAVAFSPGWVVFIALYTALAIKRKIHWAIALATIAVCIPLMAFIQIWTGFIYTCAGYGDCL